MNAPLKRPPLRDDWIEKIFDRMHGLYGSLWLDRWRSGEVIEQGGQRFDRGLLLAKATWAGELAGFADQPGRIAKALDACRHRNLPPTLPEFLEFCRQQHADMPPALPAPNVPREVVQERAAELCRATGKIAAKPAGGTAWAETPPAPGHRDSWERAIIDLAERGDQRFVVILSGHVDAGVIRSDRARAVLSTGDAVAA